MTEYRAGAKGPTWLVILVTFLAFPLAFTLTVILVAWRWAKRAISDNERLW